LDPMVFSVGHQDVPGRVGGHALQPLELPGACAPAAEAAQVRAVRVEQLDAVVAAVGHEDVALLIHGHAPEQEIHGLFKLINIMLGAN